MKVKKIVMSIFMTSLFLGCASSKKNSRRIANEPLCPRYIMPKCGEYGVEIKTDDHGCFMPVCESKATLPNDCVNGQTAAIYSNEQAACFIPEAVPK